MECSTGRKTLGSAGGRIYWTACIRMTVIAVTTVMAVCALMYVEEGRQNFRPSVVLATL